MSASALTTVAFRTDGFWTLVWLRIWFFLTSGRRRSMPPAGFVGRAYLSSAVTARPICKLLSTRMRREAYTPTAHLWRLTCEWQIGPPGKRSRKSGRSSGSAGNSWATGGAVGSNRLT